MLTAFSATAHGLPRATASPRLADDQRELAVDHQDDVLRGIIDPNAILRAED